MDASAHPLLQSDEYKALQEKLGIDVQVPMYKWRLNKVDSCSSEDYGADANVGELMSAGGEIFGGWGDDEEGGAGGGGGGGGGDGVYEDEKPLPPAGTVPSQPLLHEMVGINRLKQVSKALDKGQGVNSTDSAGETPLFWCQTAEMVDHLVAEGADIQWRNSVCNASAFYKFACQGKVKPMKALSKHLQKGGLLEEYVNEASSHTHRTPLHAAAHNGYDEVVMELLAMGADKTLQDYLGKAALDLASLRGFDDTVALLE